MRNPAEQSPLVPMLFASMFVIASIAIGLGLVASPGTVIPLTLEFAVFLMVTVGIIHVAEPPGATRDWLLKLTAVALTLRFTALVAVHFVLDPMFFAPDAWFYGRLGEVLAVHWRGEGPYPHYLERTSQKLYPYLNGFFHYALGSSHLGMAIGNVFAGVWTALVTFYLGRAVMGDQVGRLAGVLVAVFPSMVMWSVLNIRDAIATLIATLIVWLAVRLHHRFSLGGVALIVGLILILTTIRDYMGLLLLVGLVLGYSAAVRPGRVGQTLLAGTIVALFLVLAVGQLELFSVSPLESPLETMEGMRQALQHGATSGYGAEYSTGTVGGALRFLPVGVAYLLMAPFPWHLETALQTTAMPETLVWYTLIPLTIWGLRYAITKGASQNVILVGVLAVVIGCYALVEGNFGTAYRHRAQIMPVLYVFTAAGLILFRHRWRERKSSRNRLMTRLAEPPAARR